MKSKRPHPTIALSAQLFELGGCAPTEIRLVPDGQFRSSRDDRPVGIPAWVMDGDCAAAVLSAQSGLSSKFLIDYDHQTLRAAENGQPAPAAGWGATLEWRAGDGLYATQIEWTESALSAITQKEYRYISPVIRHDPTSGRVTGVLMAALTNYPAIDNLNDLAAAAALLFTNEDSPMEELIERLCYLLNVPITTTPPEMAAELDKLKTMIAQPDGTTAGLSAVLMSRTDEVAALSAQISANPDPSKFAPVAVVTELRTRLASLSATTVDNQVEQLVEKGFAEGKIIGESEKAWALELGKKDLAQLQGYLDAAQPIAALAGMQTAGKPIPETPSGLQGEALANYEFTNSTALQAEFGDMATYLAFSRANQSGSVKILGGNK